jgi:phosphate/sulfate permease
MPDNVTFVPIQTPTTHTTFTGGGDTVVLIMNPWIWVFIIGALLSVFLIFFLRRWAKKQSKKTLDMVNPSLDDLDTTAFSLRNYLLIQGGMAVVISTVCTVSLLFVLIDPIITVLTCAASIGLSGYGREKAMNAYRSTYKNRQNLEGYMRTKRGEKRRYNWVNIKFLNPYTNDEVQYKKLKASITKINADKAPDTDENKRKILNLNRQIEEKYKEIDTIKSKIKVEEDPKAKEELEESIKTIDEKVLELETSIINLGDKISETVPKVIDIDKYKSNPILINEEYLVIVIARGNLKHNIDFVDWFDYDLFGEFTVPCAGPELRELTSMHRVKTDPSDVTFRMDEYIPVFVSIFDDKLSREMLIPLESIDMETNDMIAALATAQGVERKHTAGEINTSKALTSDLLNEDRDFDLLVATRADSEAMKIIDAEKKLKTLDTVMESVTPGLLTIIVAIIFGIIIGYFWGQNSILISVGAVMSGRLKRKHDKSFLKKTDLEVP